jgi:hypothetical protein
VETVRTVKNILDHWRIESIIVFLYVDLEKPMIASIAHVRGVIGVLWVTVESFGRLAIVLEGSILESSMEGVWMPHGGGKERKRESFS